MSQNGPGPITVLRTGPNTLLFSPNFGVVLRVKTWRRFADVTAIASDHQMLKGLPMMYMSDMR